MYFLHFASFASLVPLAAEPPLNATTPRLNGAIALPRDTAN
jgi:hypothetical protein